MLRPGFEPGSPARKAGMIGRATPPEPRSIITDGFIMFYLNSDNLLCINLDSVFHFFLTNGGILPSLIILFK